MFKKNWYQRTFWLIDKRLFRWQNLPSIAKLKFIQKSYLLLFLIPLLDQFLSPMFSLPAGSRIELNVGWIYVVPEELKISFELAMPFSWQLIYYLVLCLGLGSIIYEIFSPKAIGETGKTKVTNQLVMQNFREVANGILLAKRANHFIYDFCFRYTQNIEELMVLPEEHVKSARAKGESLIQLQDPNSDKKVNQYSVYYIAEHMKLDPSLLDEALETITWFQNETKFVARWCCGLFLLTSIGLFVALFWQGFSRMLGLN